MDRFVDFCVTWGAFLPIMLVDKYIHNYWLRILFFLLVIVVQFFWMITFGLPIMLLLIIVGIHEFAKGD
jgi:hypothetical protein